MAVATAVSPVGVIAAADFRATALPVSKADIPAVAKDTPAAMAADSRAEGLGAEAEARFEVLQHGKGGRY